MFDERFEAFFDGENAAEGDTALFFDMSRFVGRRQGGVILSNESDVGQ
jgi:hypothetical protein